MTPPTSSTRFSKPSDEMESDSVSTTIRVFHTLRQKIIQCEIAPGERLKLDKLKKLLDVGATPIREALSLLTSDQLVERIDQRGFRTVPVSYERFQEILRLRLELDSIALRSSIKDGDGDWEEQLVLAHHRLSKISRSDIDHWESQHRVFHQALIQACGSPILLKFCDQLYDLNIRYRFLAGRSLSYGKRNVVKEHAAILQASVERDADKAVELLSDHYSMTGDFLVDGLKTE